MVIRHRSVRVVPARWFVRLVTDESFRRPASVTDGASSPTARSSRRESERRGRRLPSTDAPPPAAAPRRDRAAGGVHAGGRRPAGGRDDHHHRGRRATTTTVDGEFTPDPIEWDDCGGVECATLDVPLDYEDPDGEQIELYVARTPASGDRIGALFVNPGGPGAGGAEYAELPPATCCPRRSPSTSTSSASTLAASAAARPIDCGVTPSRAVRGRPHLRGCRRGRGGATSRSARSTSTTARRSTATCSPTSARRTSPATWTSVRAAMGDEQLSYLGFSYGTAIGQVYADLFPDRVRSMVLDGVRRARADRARAGRRAGRRVRDRPRALRRVLRRRRGLRHRPGHRSRRSRRCSRLAEEPGGIPVDGRRPRRRPGRGQPRHQLRAVLPEPLARPSATPSPTPLDGDGSGLVELADGYLDIGAFEIYFAVNCLDFAWPTGDPDAFFAQAKATAERVAALRRGARQRLRPLRRLAGAPGAARAASPPPAPRRSS